ncbi:MAG: hypothetical protein PHQ23_02575 [Candidatus Wallbacteria bacterium]|nr:hypothetical protein [Candidatus Wallbacteria bacterium]
MELMVFVMAGILLPIAASYAGLEIFFRALDAFRPGIQSKS